MSLWGHGVGGTGDREPSREVQPGHSPARRPTPEAEPSAPSLREFNPHVGTRSDTDWASPVTHQEPGDESPCPALGALFPRLLPRPEPWAARRPPPAAPCLVHPQRRASRGGWPELPTPLLKQGRRHLPLIPAWQQAPGGGHRLDQSSDRTQRCLDQGPGIACPLPQSGRGERGSLLCPPEGEHAGGSCPQPGRVGSAPSPFPLVRAQSQPLSRPGGQRRSLGRPRGAGVCPGGGRAAPWEHWDVDTRWTPQGRGGAAHRGPRVSPPPPPPSRPRGATPTSPQHCPTTLPQTRKAPGGPKVTVAGRLPPLRRPAAAAAKTSTTEEPPPHPRPPVGTEPRCRRQTRGVGGRSPQRAAPLLPQERGPAPLCSQDRYPGEGPSAERWGRGRALGDRASLPGAEVSARGAGGAGATVLSLQEGSTY